MSAKQAQKNSASEKLFHNYIRFIQGEVIGHDKIGYSYAISENIRNKWRYDFRWDKEIENFIILQTKTYIRTLDSRDAKSTDPNFLGAFVKMVADYLSAYFMRAPNMTRNQAKKYLYSVLWEENHYIQGLLKYQAHKRYDRKYDNRKNNKNRKNLPTQEQARRDFEKHVQIRMLIIEETHIRYKKK